MVWLFKFTVRDTVISVRVRVTKETGGGGRDNSDKTKQDTRQEKTRHDKTHTPDNTRHQSN